MKRPVYITNREGDNICTGFEEISPRQERLEREAQERAIELAREIGKEAAARRAPLKEKLKVYMVGQDDEK